MADLQLHAIQKSYGAVSVIRDVDLQVQDGEFCVFIGPSGCGKSTLLRMVAGLEDISGGELRIGGRRANDTPPAQRGVAMVFQNYALFPHMTVRENLGFGLSLARTPPSVIDTKVREVARVLQLETLLDRKPKALSGGQRQRVAIGRAIVREPGVFLFDEPLSNLDASLRVQTRFEIAKLHRDYGRASTIYVTHDQVEAMTLADRILLLNAGDAVQTEGSIAQCGRPLELYHRPRTRFVAGFIGSPRMNFLPGRLDRVEPGRAEVTLSSGERLSVSVDARRLPLGAPVTVGARPEHLVPGTATQHLLRPVLWQERLGDSTTLYMDSGTEGQPWTLRAPGHAQARLGQRIAFSLPADALHLFDDTGRALERTVPDEAVELPWAA